MYNAFFSKYKDKFSEKIDSYLALGYHRSSSDFTKTIDNYFLNEKDVPSCILSLEGRIRLIEYNFEYICDLCLSSLSNVSGNLGFERYLMNL